MSRSPRVLAMTALASGAVAAPATAADIRDITFPIRDIELPVSSLDGSVERTASKITLSADILFAFDEARLTRRAASRLEEVRAELREAEPGSVRIEGHTDDKGSDAYNDRLSARRARTVARALRGALEGVDVAVAGRGESEPVAANTVKGKDSPKGRARNRRVEIRLGR